MNKQQGESTYASALHLYDEAYRQHYEQGNIPQACILYREIIRSFPDSFESVYAVIQLEKIGMREAVKLLNSGGWVKTVAVMALILSLIAAGLATATFMSTFFAESSFGRSALMSVCSMVNHSIP